MFTMSDIVFSYMVLSNHLLWSICLIITGYTKSDPSHEGIADNNLGIFEQIKQDSKMACICVPSGIQTRDLSNNILYLNSRYQCLRPLSHHGWIKSDIMTITFFSLINKTCFRWPLGCVIKINQACGKNRNRGNRVN